MSSQGARFFVNDDVEEEFHVTCVLYLPTCLPTYLHPCMHACMHACIELHCIDYITLHYINTYTCTCTYIYIYLAKSSEKQLKMLRTSKNMHCIRHVHTLCILMCPMHPYDSPSSLPKEAFRVCGETCCEVLWPCAVDATVRVQRRER